MQPERHPPGRPPMDMEILFPELGEAKARLKRASIMRWATFGVFMASVVSTRWLPWSPENDAIIPTLAFCVFAWAVALNAEARGVLETLQNHRLEIVMYRYVTDNNKR